MRLKRDKPYIGASNDPPKRGARIFDHIDEDPPPGPIPIDSPDDPGRIGWETAISGAWPLPKYAASSSQFWRLHTISVRGEHLTETDMCWCQPVIIDRPPDGRIILHKRTQDGSRSDDR